MSRRRSLDGRVVVLLGASSGIGRATARALAEQHAHVVLAARTVVALQSLAAEVTALGAEVAVVPADVTSWDDVRAVADTAVERFGGVDAWVNLASVSVYGPVLETDVEAIRRVVEVNLIGTIHGIKAALPHLRERRGVLVNVSSVLGARSVPLQAAYCAAKHGVVGFGESLRVELAHDKVPVSVVDVLPSSIDTPFFEHARAYDGRQPAPIDPVYAPQAVADAIVAAIRRPTRTVVVGGAGRALEILQRISPRLTDALVLHGRVWEQQLRDRPADAEDNVDAPAPPVGRTRGSWPYALRRSRYTQVFGLHPSRAPLLAAGAAALSIARRRRHR